MKRLIVFLWLSLGPVSAIAAEPNVLRQELADKLLSATEPTQAWSLIHAAFPGLNPLEIADPSFFQAHDSVWKWISQRDIQFLLDLKEGPRRMLLSLASLKTLATFRDTLENNLKYCGHPEAREVLRIITACETSLRLVIKTQAGMKAGDVFPLISPVISLIAGGMLVALDRWAGFGETTIVWTDIGVLVIASWIAETVFKTALKKWTGFYRNRFSRVPPLSELRARLTTIDGLTPTVYPLTQESLHTACQDLLWLRR